jgi:type I restriction enzyme S subunit
VKSKSEIIPHGLIENRIFLIRGHKVMLDFHLAELYGVSTKSLNLGVRRNVKRLPGFSEKWQVKRLGECIRFQVGYPFSSVHFNDNNQGLRLVKNRDLKSDDQIFFFAGNYQKEYLVENGDILVGMDGDFITCLWRKGPALLNQRVGRLAAIEEIDLIFLYYYLEGPLKEVEFKTASTTVKHLSHDIIANIELPLPPITEQTTIAQILSDMDAEIESLERKLGKFKLIKQGMMQELLTGKTRLV